MNKNLIAVALASLLVGGVAVAAYQSFQGDAQDNALANPNDPALVGAGGDFVADGSIESIEYADVVNVKPVTEKRELLATVVDSEAVRTTSTTSTPREVCEDVVVQERLPERDGNVGGTVAGAVIGGLIGNQIGGGDGKKVATAAGAVAGGYVGNRVDRNHVGGRVVERVETNCRTVTDTSQSSTVVGYDVTYRNADGTTGTMRTTSKPAERISLGTQDQVIGYDVTYRYDGQEQTVRLDEEPGERLPVIDGEVVLQTAAASGDTTKG
ncbi:membrane protein [Lysobacter arseniciresistens ZS79]|uniref:Membrane protein n=1 Tax=Lysobacter arseniciresistens ZS79 TaxID=913325 RepID=A0A0A0F4D2_9GAMM|nr:glycine zipper 2TM domain-containing protein [Lysobacter arseniciresistens]KGM57709.1 membrane protein [Lysobacter arseniciresistens ZS79]